VEKRIVQGQILYKHLCVKQIQRFLPGFNHVLGRGPKSALAQARAKAESAFGSSLSELSSLFGGFIPDCLLDRADRKDHSRERTFSCRSTFWAFLSQVLSPKTSCREVVRKVQSFCSQHGLRVPGSDSSAYCQARSKLDGERLEDIHEAVCEQLNSRVQRDWLWHGHRVRVVDGTGIALPDTRENQGVYPQPAEQRRGCGFPVMQVVACFCLHSGALLGWICTKLTKHESPLLAQLLPLLQAGQLLLTDRGFSSFSNLALCLHSGIDAVMRLHQARKVDLRCGKPLGKQDRLVVWKRPQNQTSIPDEDWRQLPRTIAVRILCVRIPVRGFRVKKLWIVTTLIDPKLYPKEDIAQLYWRRWHAELFLRDIKTTMGMEQLRCKSPAMVQKELCMFAIAYNLLRLLIVQSATLYHYQPHQISFKAAADTLRQYRHAIRACRDQPRKLQHILTHLLQIIAQARVADRPNRDEPRVVKRRPKAYQRMTQPRSLMRVSPTRRNKGKKRPEPTLT
jgi:hypothetical protein